MSPTQTYDAVIIGGGHNGLVCAAYLGMSGLKVKVLERRGVVGGAAVTEEFHPGFRNSVAAYTVSLLNPKVIRDLRLNEHGLKIVERRVQNFLPTRDGHYLLTGNGRAEREAAKFSAADAARLGAFNREIDTGANVLRDLVLRAPPNLTTGQPLRGLGELFKAGLLGNRLRRLSTENLRVLYDLFTKSAASHGVEIETSAAVRKVLIEREHACGVVLTDGRVIRSDIVAANVNPRLLYTAMIPESALTGDVLRRMQNWRCGSGTFRMNVALSALPSFTALPGSEVADHHTAGIIMAPSLAYMDRAFVDARQHGWSREPIIEMLIPSTLDDTLAPKGAHVASLFCQHVAPQLPDGRSWHAHRDEVADLMIDTVERYAPGFKASVVGRQALSPLDLEETFGLIGGDIFHGALTLDQLFWARPMLGHADYRSPVAGLYHCGSGAHPGGGVTGAPGHNAARAILADWRWRRWLWA